MGFAKALVLEKRLFGAGDTLSADSHSIQRIILNELFDIKTLKQRIDEILSQPKSKSHFILKRFKDIFSMIWNEENDGTYLPKCRNAGKPLQ